MKPHIPRIICLMLAICFLIQPGVTAAEIQEDGHIIMDPERLGEYDFPGNWSDNALKFCVGNGIMNGRGNDLAADANTTRAETAALLIRLLGATVEEPDLSRFRDADEHAWYYGEMAAAVELGIMNGTSSNSLSPNDPITREQVFTLLSRAFGLRPKDSRAYRAFSDGGNCSAYATDAVSALKEMEILTGYTDGSVRPKQFITRAELAQLLYKLFTCICDDPAELPATGSVLYRGIAPIPEGYALDGKLTIGCGWQGEQTLTGIHVTDELILRPMPESSLTLTNCAVSKLVLAGMISVSGDNGVEQLIIGGTGSTAAVPAESCTVFADCTIESDVGELLCPTEGVTVTMNGNGEYALLRAKNVTLGGSGFVETVEVTRSGCEILVGHETLLEPEITWEDVQTLVVWDTVTEDTYLYEYSDLTGRIRELPAGTRLEHYYYHDGRAAASVYTEDGRFGYVDIDCIAIPESADTLEEPYPEEVMEDFVNQRGYASSTNYMLWISLKTQTVNVFQGSKGNWKLLRSMPCASGKNSTPTVRGTFAIQKNHWEWDFGTYKVRYVTVFYEGYAFHSRIYSRDYATMLDDAISYPASDGCLRMLDEDCRYIMEKMPIGTRVVVY